MKFIKILLQFIFPSKFILNRIRKNDGIILSFDDGPHPIHTPIILDELAKRDIKAAFFVTGSELEKYPDLGKRIIAEGHLLGNHTYEHLNVKNVRFSDYKKSIIATEQIIMNISSSKHRFCFRPPYSAFSLKLIWYVLTTNYSIFNWTVDSRDSFIINRNELVDHVDNLDLRNGDVLLFHEDYKQTVAALPEIIDNIEARGINIHSQMDILF